MAGKGGDDDAFEAEQELAFADGNDRLPWLESDDDDEDEGGAGTGRVLAFAFLAMLALVVVLGALWWFTRARTETGAIAEGGLIAAPPGPYKVKPANPGGRQVAGTGDTSFEVAEGRKVEGHIAETPVTTSGTEVKAGPSPAPTSTAQAGAVGVQVGAYASRAQAETGWTTLEARLALLKGRSHRIVEGTADIGTVFRLQALAGSAAEADNLCRAIRSSGGDCQVKR